MVRQLQWSLPGGFPCMQEKEENSQKNPRVMICLCLLSHWTDQVMLLTSL